MKIPINRTAARPEAAGSWRAATWGSRELQLPPDLPPPFLGLPGSRAQPGQRWPAAAPAGGRAGGAPSWRALDCVLQRILSCWSTTERWNARLRAGRRYAMVMGALKDMMSHPAAAAWTEPSGPSGWSGNGRQCGSEPHGAAHPCAHCPAHTRRPPLHGAGPHIAQACPFGHAEGACITHLVLPNPVALGYQIAPIMDGH